jgi:HNH endonuclease
MRTGGPRARGRRAASWTEWAAIREQVLARAGWRCQACRVRRRLDVHHVVKRSQGGSDFDLDQLVALCRWCHDQTDAPYERGRLVVTALGAGQFTCEVVQRAAHGSSPARVPTFAHVGKTDARDVVRSPDGTTVNSQSDASWPPRAGS